MRISKSLIHIPKNTLKSIYFFVYLARIFHQQVRRDNLLLFTKIIYHISGGVVNAF